MQQNTLAKHRIVTKEQWIAERKALLSEEKAFTRQRDELNRRRRALPWYRVEKTYTFETCSGTVSLSELFGSRSQLIVYHFMFGDDWDAGCPSCSFLCDHIDGMLPHLRQRDVSLAAVSRANVEKITRYKYRMGWQFDWVSSSKSAFNFDFEVSFSQEQLRRGDVFYNYTLQEGYEELPGLSVFFKNASGAIFHTYSTYSRGADLLIGTYNYLDLLPKGRGETQEEDLSSWVKRHDEY